MNDDTIHQEIRLKEDVRIRFAVKILENGLVFGTETGYLVSIQNALDILRDEGDGNE